MSNTPKQFVGKLSMNCLSVFDHFVKLALKGLKSKIVSLRLRQKFEDDAYALTIQKLF